jgi:hypothetical protein
MRTLLLVLILGVQACALATVPSVQGVKLETPPLIDGVLDDDAWQQAAKVERFIDPFTGKEPPDRTIAWIAYDNLAIYVAFHCLDPHPSGIVSHSIQPGASFEGEDYVAVTIDPQNTRSWSGLNRFRVNALGTQGEELAGGRAGKREWRGVWQAASKRTEDGWTVEMRIPWAMLSNVKGGSSKTISLNFMRYQRRTQTRSYWADLTPATRLELMGQWVEVEPPVVSTPRRIEFLGYTAPEVSENRSESQTRMGLDARYPLTDRLTALMSFNPDFRNIEEQIEGIGFTRTERYLRDVRPFFVEGQGFFQLTGQYTFGEMFYSRRIESFDWGAKTFGRLQPQLSVGALATVDADAVDSVVNMRQEFGGAGHANIFMTSRTTPGAGQDMAAGFSSYRRIGNWAGEAEYVQASRPGTRDAAGALAVHYDIPRYFAIVRYMFVEPEFQPALAFIPHKNRRGAYFFGEHRNEFRSGFIRSINASVSANQFHQFDGSLHDRSIGAGLNVFTANHNAFGIFVNRGRFMDEGEQTLLMFASFNVNSRQRRMSLSNELGSRGGKPSNYFSANFFYRPFGRLDLGLSSSIFSHDGTSRQSIFTAGWEFDAARSFTTRVVERNGKVNAYCAFRSAGFQGAETFLIIGDPNSPTFQRRMSLKMVWAF